MTTNRKWLPSTIGEWAVVIVVVPFTVVMLVFIAYMMKDSHDWRIQHDKRVAVCTKLDAQYLSLYDVEDDNDVWSCYANRQLVYTHEGDVR